MQHYIGLDVSGKVTAICVMDSEGKILHEGEAPTNPEAIALHLADPQLCPVKVGLESGAHSHYLTRELKQRGLPAICIDSRVMAAFMSATINKTDRNDARGIANAMRCNQYCQVHQRSEWSVEVNTLLGSRRTLLNQRTQVKNTIRGLLKTYGMLVRGSGQISFSKQVTCILEGLPSIARFGLEHLLSTYEHLCGQVEAFDKALGSVAADKKEVALLRSVPGVGLITALTYLAEVDDPTRFSDSRLVGAYVGLTPTQYSSGETVRQGRVSRRGPRELRSLLYEAAVVHLYRTKAWNKVKAWGMRLAMKKGKKKAAVAVARKLSVVMHRMLLTNETFCYGDKAA